MSSSSHQESELDKKRLEAQELLEQREKSLAEV